MTVFVIAIPVLLLLVALMIFSSLRRREADRVTGHLSAETRRRDRSAHAGSDGMQPRRQRIDVEPVR